MSELTMMADTLDVWTENYELENGLLWLDSDENIEVSDPINNVDDAF
jgi:hypothetical protein